MNSIKSIIGLVIFLMTCKVNAEMPTYAYFKNKPIEENRFYDNVKIGDGSILSLPIINGYLPTLRYTYSDNSRILYLDYKDRIRYQDCQKTYTEYEGRKYFAYVYEQLKEKQDAMPYIEDQTIPFPRKD